MKQLLILEFLLLCIYGHVCAQELTKKVIEETTLEIARLIEENYVLRDKGLEIAEFLTEELNTGTYYSARNWKDLDSLISSSLNEISNDGHLFVWNNEKLAAQLSRQTLKSESNPSEEKEDDNFFNDQNAVEINFGFRQVQIMDGNTGYIQLSQINISEASLNTLYAAMEMVKNTGKLIIDLRNNGGGGSAVGPVLETFFFEQETELLEFRTREGKTDMHKTVTWLNLKRYTNPVYIIINHKTASAAEAFAFSLQHTGRATIIGEPSSGAAHMNTYFRLNDNFVLSVSTSAPFLPGTEITWEQKGIQPDLIMENISEMKIAEIVKKIMTTDESRHMH